MKKMMENYLRYTIKIGFSFSSLAGNYTLYSNFSPLLQWSSWQMDPMAPTDKSWHPMKASSERKISYEHWMDHRTSEKTHGQSVSEFIFFYFS